MANDYSPHPHSEQFFAELQKDFVQRESSQETVDKTKVDEARKRLEELGLLLPTKAA